VLGDTAIADDALGRMLVAEGSISVDQYRSVSALARETGGHIEDILVSRGVLEPGEMLGVMASRWRLPVLRLLPGHTDDELVRTQDGQQLLVEKWMPVQSLDDGTIQVATAVQPDEARTAYIEGLLGSRVEFGVATPWQIKRALLRIFGDDIADDAANELFRQNPRLSARQVLSRSQFTGLVFGVIALLLLLVMWPGAVIAWTLGIVSLVFLAGTLFKFAVSLRGARFDVVERISREKVLSLRDEHLPTYTVLVPVFREANIVAQPVGNLGDLDYPKDKLEVLILIEEDDTETRDALRRAEPPGYFHVVTVPRGYPQTKPRACNVGLFFATGEFLVIYDAEDRPDPDQLKKALIAFRRGGPKTVCVQAALNYFNAEENFLTRMFTLEYSYWFDYMLAGLDALDLPIPLGGTSNHFRTAALTELGGWDPYNVTEDADLGIRASALGYRVGVIDSTTMEEANTSIPNFIRQRSRWIKGYMQTALVHARSPFRLTAQIGPRRFAAFVLLIAGTPITFLGVIPGYLVTAISFAVQSSTLSELLPVWVVWLALVNFLLGNFVMVYLGMMGPYKRGRFRLLPWAMLNPLYWVLHSVAAYKALWQLVSKPHYWEKTEHGLTAHSV
jgi:glycosyltransferase XagB